MAEGGDFSGALRAVAPAGPAALGRHRMALPCAHSSCCSRRVLVGVFPAAMGMWMAGRAEGSAWQWCSQPRGTASSSEPLHTAGASQHHKANRS